MDFDDERFPVAVSLDAVGGPRFKTSIASMASGAEQRIAWWPTERGEWTVNFRSKLPKEYRPMLAFFRAIAQGMANTFRFKDWTDYMCEVGDGQFVLIDGVSPPAYQMVKVYTYGAQTYNRVIRKPINGKVTTDATGLDYATGIASSDGTWSGEFDVQARMGNDPLRCQVIDRNPTEGLIVAFDGLEIVETMDEIES